MILADPTAPDVHPTVVGTGATATTDPVTAVAPWLVVSPLLWDATPP